MKSSEKIKREVALLLPFENRDIVDNVRLAKKIISAIRSHDRRERKLTKRTPDKAKAAALPNSVAVYRVSKKKSLANPPCG